MTKICQYDEIIDSFSFFRCQTKQKEGDQSSSMSKRTLEHSRKFNRLDLEIRETSCPRLQIKMYIFLQLVLSLLLHCRMFSKSARSRLSACWWAACARGDSSSSSNSRHREAPAGKAWTSWINPPPRQTSAMSTCEPPEGVVAQDLQQQKSSWKKPLNFVKSRKKRTKEQKMLKTQAL